MNPTPPAADSHVVIPSGRVNFSLENGQTFSLSVLAFLEELAGLWEHHKGNHADYCRAVSHRVGELNPGLVLALDEADSLIAAVNELAIKKKRKQENDLQQLQMSAFSMASGAVDSPPKS